LVAFYIAQKLPHLKTFFVSGINDFSKYNLLDWIDVYAGKFTKNRGNVPLVYPLWYVRDLFLIFLISPILKVLIRKVPFTTLFAFAFLYFSLTVNFSNWYYVFISPEALLFFTIGCLLGKNINILEKFDQIKVCDVLLILGIGIIVELLFRNKFVLIRDFDLLIGILLYFRLTENIIKYPSVSEKINKPRDDNRVGEVDKEGADDRHDQEGARGRAVPLGEGFHARHGVGRGSEHEPAEARAGDRGVIILPEQPEQGPEARSSDDQDLRAYHGQHGQGHVCQLP